MDFHMIKITKLHFEKSNGLILDITIKRIYGPEKELANFDGDVFDCEKFKDECFVTIDASGTLYGHYTYFRYPVTFVKNDQPAIFMYLLSAANLPLRDAKGYFIFIDEEWNKAIYEACTERLINELTPEEKAEIEDVKRAIKHNRVQPYPGLKIRIRELDDMCNKGVKGNYNPYI